MLGLVAGRRWLSAMSFRAEAPSGAAVEESHASRPRALYRDEHDSSTARLRRFARNDSQQRHPPTSPSSRRPANTKGHNAYLPLTRNCPEEEAYGLSSPGRRAVRRGVDGARGVHRYVLAALSHVPADDREVGEEAPRCEVGG